MDAAFEARKIKMRLIILRILAIPTMMLVYASHQARDNCGTGLTVCAPQGATLDKTPGVGTAAFESLYVDIVSSSLPESSKRSTDSNSVSLCCQESSSCLLMANLKIPFCYDPFTTNYFLSDGSYGTIVEGAYNSSHGDLANLLSGQYTLANGSTGNIYSNTSAPNTSTLPMPSQFTASGVGSAIPASALGGEITVTYTTTFSGTTISASTIPPSTIAAVVTSETIIFSGSGSTVSGTLVASEMVLDSTILGTTLAGSTVPPRTIEPFATTITTTYPGSPSPSITGGKKKSDGKSSLQTPSRLALCFGLGLLLCF